jgi:ankyrin repeat protein
MTLKETVKLNDAMFYCIKHPAKRGSVLKNIVALVEKGAEPWAIDDKGRTLLHYAAEQGDMKLINHFTRKFKIHPNVEDYSGQTAMHMAATQFYGNVITALHGAGGDVNAADKKGVRPLHIAAVHGHIPVACKLIKKGADIFAKSYAGRQGYCSLTAREAAIIANQAEMAEILTQKEAKELKKQIAGECPTPPVFICSHDDGNVAEKTRENQKS